MDTHHSDNIIDLFDAALELPADRRASFLAKACAADPAARHEIESLLGHVEHVPQTFLSGIDQCQDPPEGHPARIGQYEIIRTIGTGGMGIVYEALQHSPQRTVALKVLRSGVVGRDLRRRFEREAEVLARLQHPGIAHVYDAGIADAIQADGAITPIPYFAMERVPGRPLNEYLSAHSPDVEASLELFLHICDAVQHAHAKGVVHRDLKPGNIIVDDSGAPKVLDFGVARVVDADVVNATVHTHVGQLVGTLPYMSPEQVRGDSRDIDTRTDVYALGIILHEMLTGTLPYEVSNRSLPEAARIICEEEPAPPSSVNSVFRGDIETIIARALAKEAGRRYQSVGELSAELRRHLRDEPIVARPPSVLYQMKKFARRNRAVVAGAGLAAVALLSSASLAVWWAMEAEYARREETELRRVADARTTEALGQAYRSSLMAASSALERHLVLEARKRLADADAGWRGWEWAHLSARTDDSILTLQAFDHARTLDFSPDGSRLVGCGTAESGSGCVLKLFDLATGQTLGTRWDPAHYCSAARFLDDGTRVGVRLERTQPRDGKWWVWNPESENETLTAAEMRPTVGLGNNGHISADFDPVLQVLRICEIESQTELSSIAHSDLPKSVAFDPQGRYIAVGLDSGSVSIRSLPALEQLGTLTGHAQLITDVAFNADGSLVLSASADGTARVWDSTTFTEVRRLVGHEGRLYAAVFSPDDALIATGGEDDTVRLWNASDGSPRVILHGHSDHVIEVRFAPDGALLASASSDGSIKLWDLSLPGQVQDLLGHHSFVYPVAYSPDGRRIVSGGWDGYVNQPGALRIWDATTGDAIIQTGHDRQIIRELSYSPDGARLAVASQELDWKSRALPGGGQVALLDADTLRQQAVWNEYGMSEVAFDPTGQRLLIFNFVTGRCVIRDVVSHDTLFEHTIDRRFEVAPRRGASWSPNGKTIAICHPDHGIQLLDGRDYSVLRTLTGHRDDVLSLKFSRDSRLLFSSSEDLTNIVWDVRTGSRAAELTFESDAVLGAAFSPDDSRLVTGGYSKIIRLWDTATWREVAQLPGHTAYVFSLAYSPDGRTLISSSGDSTIRVWDTRPRQEIRQAREDRKRLLLEVQPMVDELFDRLSDAEAVAAAVRQAGVLTEDQREVALQCVLARAVQQADEQ